MQKGHFRSIAPILLLTLVATLALSLVGAGAFAARTDVGPLIPINGLRSADAATRPIFGHVLPTPPVMLQARAKQASGPDADDDLTASAATSFELQPNGSPGASQNRIVFSSNGADTNGDGQIDSIPATGANYDLWIMRSDGSEQYKLMDLPGDQVDPCYDPGGRMLVFSQKVNNVWQIFTIELRDPTVVTQITTTPGNKRHPTWSADFNWIGFQSDVNGTWDLYKILATGQGQPIQITSGAANDTDPAWSPTGALIAFTREIGGQKRIYTVDPDGANVTAVSNGGGSAAANDQEPAWSQTGSELAFASTRQTEAGDAIPDFNIWRMPATGEVNAATPTLVSNTSVTDTYDDTDPTWTVDIDRAPTRIAFTSTRANNQPDIWAMQMKDWVAPVLQSVPSATPRVCTPGADVTVSVPVYDKDSGVKQVFAYFKDPDSKIYLQQGGHYFDANYAAGVRFLEWDCNTVGQVELTDDNGDGVFTGAWTTPAVAAGHDYIIDIVVSDNAGNSQRYDDVYGFSTKTFSPRNNVLFVDDYCEGQLFLAQLGWNNDLAAAFPVESYYTSNPSYYPGVESTTDFDSIKDAFGDGYDTWRVICRGPVTPAVYQYYLPTVEHQLDPAKLDNEGSLNVTADREVAVADRAVIWAAPHTGDVWIADGSIMDASTQADVASFVRRGGRLFMSGEDIAWALTLNGTHANSFLSGTLHSSFVQDCAIPYFDIYLINFVGRNWRMQQTTAEFGLTGQATDPVAYDPWVGVGSHAADLANLRTWLDTGDNPNTLNSARFSRPNSPWFTDAAQYSVRPDAIAPLDSVKLYGLSTNEGTTNYAGPCVGVRYQDASNPNGGRVVFLSFGFEQINRGYHTPTNLPPHCRNLRSHLIHNTLCWERTGGFQGRVVSISDGGQAINDPAPIVSARINGQVMYAVRCQKDGTYIMQGLPPGHYDLQAARPGFEIDHYDGEFVHGGQYPRIIDFAIKRAQPGAVSGTVTAATDGRPLANVTVSIAPDPNAVPALPADTPVPKPILTSADGSYTLPYVAPGAYIVTANGQAVLYSTKTQATVINPGDTTTVNFALDAANGTLQAAVTDVDTSAAISGAAVTATNSTGIRIVIYTDDAGQASTDLAPGTYTVVVTAAGYKASTAQTVLIEPAATNSVTAALQHQPGGSILGRVVGAGSGTFLGGATIHVFFGNVEIASTQSSSTAVATAGGVDYNYSIPAVDTGDVTVTAERSGFTAVPASRTVTISSGVTTRDVNFQMQALFTFPKGLQLVSFPADYSSIDPAVLLGVSNPSALKIATWEAARQRYRLYPDAPADRFRIGVGYWMNLSSPADLSEQGTPAEDPVEIPLEAGWNLIGCPYDGLIDFYTANVRDMDNAVCTLQQSFSRGILGSGLYAYVLGGYQPVAVLSRYTGYWLKANQPSSLIISAKTGALSVDQTRDASPKPENGWILPLQTTCAGTSDASTFIGAAQAATAGCDFGTDQPKPPVPAMGRYVYTTIDNHDWANYGGDYAVDVRPAGTTSVWNLKVSTNLVGQPVRLAWGDMSSLPHDVRPVLVDLDSGQKVYMRTTSAYVFTAKETARRLQITVDPSGTRTLVISPLSATSSSAGTAISYSLSDAASIDITLSNLAGRSVRKLVVAQMQLAGQNTVLWDGRDKNGSMVPAGRYLISITGKTDSGLQVRTIMPLLKEVR